MTVFVAVPQSVVAVSSFPVKACSVATNLPSSSIVPLSFASSSLWIASV